MNIIVRKRDIYICTIALMFFGSWVAYGLYDAHLMGKELNVLAQKHMNHHFDTEPEADARELHDYLAVVDSAKAFHFFGKGWGVIHFYTREKGDSDMKSFKGFEYYYAREKNNWVLKDSAGCGAKEHHLRAFDEMLTLGMNVEGHVFDQALGLDFDWRKFVRNPDEYEAHPDHSHEEKEHKHEHGETHDHNETTHVGNSKANTHEGEKS
jgi:hypothetical protein